MPGQYFIAMRCTWSDVHNANLAIILKQVQQVNINNIVPKHIGIFAMFIYNDYVHVDNDIYWT